jgi:flagellar basal-body rod protein FlgF
MDKIIYTSMTGANAAAQRQAVLAHNLANAGTNGFRAEMSTFRSVPLQGTGPARACLRWRPPPAIRTPRPCPAHRPCAGRHGHGPRLVCRAGPGRQEAYTRNGVFEISPEGQLVNSNGQAVLSDGGAPIDIPPESTISLGSDGTLTAKMGNQLPVAVGRVKLVTPPVDEPLVRGDDGFFRAAQGDALPNDETARLLSGSIEGSNVNSVETMVGMIAASRQFEQQMKLLQTAETNDKSASQLLSLNG